jgi:hypothetical protein
MTGLKQAPLIGLLVGAGAWAISTQLNYSLVSISCESAAGVVPLIATICLVMAIAGGALSLPPWPALGELAGQNGGADPRPRRFFSIISILAVFVFALAILLQGVASLIVSGCQR